MAVIRGLRVIHDNMSIPDGHHMEFHKTKDLQSSDTLDLLQV